MGNANDLRVAMYKLETAMTITMLAVKADGLGANDARTAFAKVEDLLADAHNDIDCVRQAVEGQP